jgi:hypothetical protein
MSNAVAHLGNAGQLSALPCPLPALLKGTETLLGLSFFFSAVLATASYICMW